MKRNTGPICKHVKHTRWQHEITRTHIYVQINPHGLYDHIHRDECRRIGTDIKTLVTWVRVSAQAAQWEKAQCELRRLHNHRGRPRQRSQTWGLMLYWFSCLFTPRKIKNESSNATRDTSPACGLQCGTQRARMLWVFLGVVQWGLCILTTLRTSGNTLAVN